MSRWVIALCAATALVAASSAAPQVVVARTVFHTADLRSNAITGFSVACPPGYLAVSGGIANAAPGVTMLSIRPLGLRTYAFGFGNPATNPRERVRVAVSCRRIRAGRGTSPYLRLTPVKLKLFQVKPGTQKAATLSCPSGTVPAGAGFDLDQARSKAVGRFTGTSLSVRRQTQTLRGLSFAVRNTGPRARAVALYATCLTVVRPPGASRERLHVTLITDTTPIRAGSHVVKHSCPRGWTALSTGFALPSALTMDGSAALGTGGKWSVTNRGDSAALADLQLVCGRLSS